MTSRVPSSSPRRLRGRRAGLTALLAGSLIAGSAVIATSFAGPASATNYGTDVITLQTGATNEFVLHRGAENDVKQPITVRSCVASSSSTPVAVMSGSGGNGKVGLRQGSLGVIDKGTGESCGQLNAPNEALTIDLGSKVAVEAVLDVELQKDAVVLATLTNGADVTYVELQSGGSVTGSPSTVTVPATKVAICQTDNSSANNAGPSDNCRWVIDDAPFTKISLKALKGNASLEGGADGLVTRLSKSATGVTDVEPLPAAKTLTYFKLLKVCTEVNTQTTIASTGGTGLPSGLVKRSLKNLDGSLCLDDGLTAEAKDANTVDIIKRGQAFGQYITKIGWKKAPTTADVLSEAISKTTIEFDIGLGPNNLSPERTLPWCPTSLFDDATSEVEPVTNGRILTPLPPSVTDNGVTADELLTYNITDMDGVATNAVQFACIQDRDVEYVAGTFVVSDVIYVLGDLRMRG